MELIDDTIRRYTKTFGSQPDLVVVAPGRVNLIGEHTDYNGGFVLPIAIDRSVILAGGRRDDGLLALHSIDFQSSAITTQQRPERGDVVHWSDFLKGVSWALQMAGHPVGGMNVCLRGTVPIAAGLSSSAALEVAASILFATLSGLVLPAIDLVSIAHRAEAEFVGVRCGVMDQFVSMMGRKDHAVFLDCASLASEHVRCPEDMCLVICDTGSKRELAASAYNRRRAECEEAAGAITARFGPGTGFRTLTPAQLTELQTVLPPLLIRRTRHVVSENGRVCAAVTAMRANDLPALGHLMLQSHASLRDDFEVSSRELDAIVEIASGLPGVFGARMTGAGFGGSAICLIRPDSVDAVVDGLRKGFHARIGKSLSLYLTSAADGAGFVFPGKEHPFTPYITPVA